MNKEAIAREKARDERRINKFGLKTLFLKNNSKWRTKLLKAKFMNMENRVADTMIRTNKILIEKL